MEKYKHIVQYYETDKMGVAHHSNFIRWMEEARVYLMAEYGFGYDRVEQEGVIIPVIGVECKYISMAHFRDEVLIDTKVKNYNGIKMDIEYTMTKQNGFLNKNEKIINVKKILPELNVVIENMKREC